MRRVLLTTTAVALLAATALPAIAADLPPRYQMPMKAPPVVPVGFNWTGFYVGVNAGGGFGISSFNFPQTPTGNFKTSGFIGGGTAGYNYEIGQFVLGAEGDIDGATTRGSKVCLAGKAICQTKNDWLGTARGRVGYSIDRFLPYVTGGLAVGDIKATDTPFAGMTKTKAGWTVGGGVEVAVVGNVSAKVEYLHVDLGSINCGIACGVAAPTPVKFREEIVRGGVNYRF
jgi:outer membrane immunogenic protein